jgi:hypothetical protein
MYFTSNENEVRQKVRNQFFIDYHTHLFPLPVTFTGFFKEVLTFSESADKPRSRDYSMGFIVEDVSPSMNEIFADLHKNTRVLISGGVSQQSAYARDP